MVKNGQHRVSSKTVPKVLFLRREGSASGVDVIDLEELHTRRMDHSILRAHRIEFHILLLVTGGRGWHMVDFVRYPVGRGCLVHIAPGQVHLFDGEDDLAGFLVLFQPEVRGLEVSHLNWPPSMTLETEDFHLLESLIQVMFELSARQLSASPDRLRWRMLPVVLELTGSAVERHLVREGPERSSEFEAFDALLNENFARHRNLSWYADELGASEKTLSRWCRRVVGSNAKLHIDRRVTLEAKRLLVHTHQTVESIGNRLGFSESTNFVKFFKRIEGVTPLSFRDSFDLPA